MTDIDRKISAFLELTFGHHMGKLTEVQRNDLVFTIGTLALRHGDSEEAIDVAIAWLERCALQAESLAADSIAWARETARLFEDSDLVSHEARIVDGIAVEARRRINGNGG
jgi:hypothetical protein